MLRTHEELEENTLETIKIQKKSNTTHPPAKKKKNPANKNQGRELGACWVHVAIPCCLSTISNSQLCSSITCVHAHGMGMNCGGHG
jgi:hypothetical protein